MPDAEVWVVVGDGGFQMTLCELATCAQEDIKVNVAIINNGYLGMVRQWQEFFYERRYAATPITSPDFVKLAEAHGLTGAARRRPAPTGRVARSQAAREHTGTVRHRLPRRAGRQRLPDGAGRRRPARHDPPAVAGAGGNRGRTDRSPSLLQRSSSYVENKPGVLNRVASLFRRRAYNIESLTVGRTERPASRA